MNTACAIHDFQPVNNMRAVYRCAACGGFSYKQGARTGLGKPAEMKMYCCHVTGCQSRVVVIFPEVRYRRRHKPSCQEHRPDAV